MSVVVEVWEDCGVCEVGERLREVGGRREGIYRQTQAVGGPCLRLGCAGGKEPCTPARRRMAQVLTPKSVVAVQDGIIWAPILHRSPVHQARLRG